MVDTVNNTPRTLPGDAVAPGPVSPVEGVTPAPGVGQPGTGAEPAIPRETTPGVAGQNGLAANAAPLQLAPGVPQAVPGLPIPNVTSGVVERNAAASRAIGASPARPIPRATPGVIESGLGLAQNASSLEVAHGTAPAALPIGETTTPGVTGFTGARGKDQNASGLGQNVSALETAEGRDEDQAALPAVPQPPKAGAGAFATGPSSTSEASGANVKVAGNDVPPAVAEGGASSDGSDLVVFTSAALSSVGKLMPRLPDVATSLLSALVVMGEMAATAAEGDIKTAFEGRRTLFGLSSAQARKAQGERDKVEKGGFWNKLKSVADTISPVIDVTTLVVALSAGGPLGTLAVIGAVAALSGDANSITQQITGHGMVGLAYTAMGNEEGAAKADMIVGLLITGVAGGVSIVQVLSPNTVKAIQDVKNMSDTIKNLESVAKTADKASRVVGGIADVQGGINNFKTSGHLAAAEMATAMGERFDAEAKWLAQLTDEKIKDAGKRMEGFLDMWKGFLDIQRNKSDALISSANFA